MIEETDLGFAVSCDFCSNEFEVQAEDFQAAVRSAKHRGWRIFKNSEGEWQHKCPACLEGSDEIRLH